MDWLPRNKILQGHVLDVLRTLPDGCVQMCVTSPPYLGLRDFGLPPQAWEADPGCSHCPPCGTWSGSLGLEPTVDLYTRHLVEVFREVRRVLRNDGTFWLNMGDCYARTGGAQEAGLKEKDLVGVPWRLAFALRDDGWWLRSDIIWAKPASMPESVTDRPTRSHDYIFLMAKSPRYYYDVYAIREPLAPASVTRIRQANFDNQTGGPKDYGLTKTNPNRSARRALRNLKENAGMPPKIEDDPERWANPTDRNKRSVWTISSESLAFEHFAVYPKALVEPCILAGTSEKGACSECGAPWRRLIEKKQYGSWHDHKVDLTEGAGQGGTQRKKRYYEEYEPGRTLGWAPTCEHKDTPLRPCVVLDPFLGSGTTALVARRAGRDWIGVELSRKYCEIAKARLEVGDGFKNRLVNPEEKRVEGRLF